MFSARLGATGGRNLYRAYLGSCQRSQFTIVSTLALCQRLAKYDSFHFGIAPTLAKYDSFHSWIVPALAQYDRFHFGTVPTLAKKR